MQQRYPGFFDYFVMEQHFRRYASAGTFNNRQPLWFYFAVLPLLTLLVINVMFWRWPRSWRQSGRYGFLVLALLALSVDTGRMAKKQMDDFTNAIFTERNFYGPLKVSDAGNTRILLNGNVVHGRQLLGPGAASEPVSYYGPDSGIGRAVNFLRQRGPLKIGVVGLGAGSMAAHGRAGDHVVFYEINPAVPDIARKYFSFLTTSGAKSDIHMGDARLSLEKEPAQGFDEFRCPILSRE